MREYRVMIFLQGGHRFDTKMDEAELADLQAAHGRQSGMVTFEASGSHRVDVLATNIVAIQYHAFIN